MLSQEFQVLNQGKSEVHLTGYQTTTDIMDPEADLESDDDEEALADPNIVVRLCTSQLYILYLQKHDHSNADT